VGDRVPCVALMAEHGLPIEALCLRYGVSHLALFGSALNLPSGVAARDIDLTVEFVDVAEFSPARQYFDFKAELERLLDRPVDLVELSAMQACRLKRIIERTRVSLHGETASRSCR
jgi:uncharacterized protein